MYKSLQLRVKLSRSTDHVTDRNEKCDYEGQGSSLHSAQLPHSILSNGQLRREADPSHPFSSKIKNAWNCRLPPISHPSK
jgi:hypothetical protein